MVSKDISNPTPNRVPETRIVGPSRFRKPLEFVPAEVVIVKPSPYSGNGSDGDNVIVPPPLPKKGDEEEEVIDAPSLSDIESVNFEEYKNKEGVTKIKVKIKVRNSSINKSNVKGVDARITPIGIL